MGNSDRSNWVDDIKASYLTVGSEWFTYESIRAAVLKVIKHNYIYYNAPLIYRRFIALRYLHCNTHL